MENPDHEYWMRKAILLAKEAWGNTHPNPMVGAILVNGNQVLSQGVHEKAGCDHAERAALKKIELSDLEKKTATLYVTLEPCCTHGRTPPCTEIIIEKGIRKVVIGASDPNPIHHRKGVAMLREAGVEVIEGVLEKECADLNLIFNHNILHEAPFIALKSAMTLDGRTATKDEHSRWITGEAARLDVMKWRAYFPAIAVGAGTAIADDPSLTIRGTDKAERCPVRLIFDRSLRTRNTLDSLKVFNDTWATKTILITSGQHSDSELRPYLDKGISLCRLDYAQGNFPLAAFRAWCREKELWGIFVEGGQSLNSSLLNCQGADYLFAYHAPKLFLSNRAPGLAELNSVSFPSEAPRLKDPIHGVFGDDILTRGHLVYPEKTTPADS